MAHLPKRLAPTVLHHYTWQREHPKFLSGLEALVPVSTGAASRKGIVSPSSQPASKAGLGQNQWYASKCFPHLKGVFPPRAQGSGAPSCILL